MKTVRAFLTRLGSLFYKQQRIVALTLRMIGICGVLAYLVTLRKQEFGSL